MIAAPYLPKTFTVPYVLADDAQGNSDMSIIIADGSWRAPTLDHEWCNTGITDSTGEP